MGPRSLTLLTQASSLFFLSAFACLGQAQSLTPASSTSAAQASVGSLSTRTEEPAGNRRIRLASTVAQTETPVWGRPLDDGDQGEEPMVRQAAVEALGKLTGSVVVVDPSTGKILAIVNPRLAWKSGYQPCSTFKPAVALAALEEGIIQPDRTRLRLGKKWFLTLEDSLALSNNLYFEKLGSQLGMEKLRAYAERFGFGEEPAVWEAGAEPAGRFPPKAPPAKRGGVGRIASFGQGISQTVFQLASFMSALANGGTLYYLQYPRSPQEKENFQPRLKRELDIASWMKPVREGLEKAVVSGTAKNARQPDVPILGKTGTCSENGQHLGWFAGFAEVEGGPAVVVLLRGPQRVGGGPRAAEVAGRLFRQLADQNYFARFLRKDWEGAPPATIHLPILRAR